MSKKTYSFYIKGDHSQEAISLVNCENKDEAIEIFCHQKQLTEEDFLELFEIQKENGNNKKDI